jgi:hypothetical protein
MVTPKKRKPANTFERRLILVSAILAAGYLIVVGTLRDQIDFVYVIGLLFMVIGYFAKDLTDRDEDDDMPPPRGDA